jgi:hypothetical protein
MRDEGGARAPLFFVSPAIAARKGKLPRILAIPLGISAFHAIQVAPVGAPNEGATAMIPTAPTLPAGGPGPAPLVEAARTQPAPAATPAAAPPDLGRTAVTQAEATRLPPMEPQSLARLNVPEIPPDPPPVKGLGIPPLDTTQVGDFDEIDSPPPPEVTGPGAAAISDLLAALQDSPAPGLDRRA